MTFHPKEQKKSVQAGDGHNSNLYFSADDINCTQFTRRSETNTTTSTVVTSQADKKHKKFHFDEDGISFYHESTSSKQ